MRHSDFPARFGRLIEERRRQQGITQEGLATKVGMTQPSISAWERGKAVPTAERLLGVLAVLGIDLAEVVALFTDGDEPEAAA
jgi:transcriptional regulator with XRE-family HTH domain